MGDVEPLANRDAIAKIRHIATGEVAMLCTSAGDHSLDARPMGTSAVDKDGTIWFFSQSDSFKNHQIERNPAVQLMYSLPHKSEFLALLGNATIVREKRKIDELWIPLLKPWFADGKDDPKVSLIRFSPTSGHYWDVRHNRMVQLIKIAIGAAIGREMDDSVEGDLRL